MEVVVSLPAMLRICCYLLWSTHYTNKHPTQRSLLLIEMHWNAWFLQTSHHHGQKDRFLFRVNHSSQTDTHLWWNVGFQARSSHRFYPVAWLYHFQWSIRQQSLSIWSCRWSWSAFLVYDLMHIQNKGIHQAKDSASQRQTHHIVLLDATGLICKLTSTFLHSGYLARDSSYSTAVSRQAKRRSFNSSPPKCWQNK